MGLFWWRSNCTSPSEKMGYSSISYYKHPSFLVAGYVSLRSKRMTYRPFYMAEAIRDEKYTKASRINENHVNPYPEVTVNADLELFYDPKLKELEEAFYKGDGVGMIADKGGSTYR